MQSVLPCTCRVLGRQAIASTSTGAARLALQPRKHLSSSSLRSYPRKARNTNDADAAEQVEPWYTREVPHFAQPSRRPLEAPPPPSTIPAFLRPLWTHLFESPFLDQNTIRFIDERVVDDLDGEEGEEADRSVSSFVDWKIVASLRNGRERGIRGACDGVKIAVSALWSLEQLTLMFMADEGKPRCAERREHAK